MKKSKKIKILKEKLKKLEAEIKKLRSSPRLKKKGKRRPKDKGDKKKIALAATEAEGPQVKAKDATQPIVRVAAVS